MTIKERFEQVICYFQREMPVAETELHYSSPYELLVAVILSAQCTDKRVNLITPAFFQHFPNVESLALASQDAIFEMIRSCSYPNNKAKHLSGMARMLVNDFQSLVPEKIEDLVKLPGVGRKTANVIASVVFEMPAMAVDTHVFRVSARLGLSENAKNPLETEKQLLAYFPENLVRIAHHWLILHGRYTCTARNPKCENCGLQEYCKKFQGDQKERARLN
jgi:endonuclease III